jgi:hypothetical protein
MTFQLAILNVLAKWPERRIELHDVKREVELIIASEDQAWQLELPSTLGDVDIFQSGLVSRNDAGLQITDAGLWLLRSLESSRATSRETSSALISPALGMIDTRTDTLESPQVAPEETPVFLQRAFGSKIHEPSRNSSQLSNFFAFIAATIQTMPAVLRRHFAREASNQEAQRPAGGTTTAAFAFLSLIAVVTGIGAAIALGQIKSLKSEIAVLHRELLPLRERLGKLEQIENTKRDSNQQEEAQNKPDMEKNRAGGETRAEQAALNLSREEIQLIRDYIKPATSAGSGAAPINVGDPVSGAMIPLPSPITEKLPKLVGASFMTRNGAIIISTKNSRRADAVLAPN